MRKLLEPPIVCDNCESDRIGLTTNAVLYGNEKGKWPYCYYCDDCGAMVGCHQNTRNPMGLMANSRVRRKRARLHSVFDPIWELDYLSRDDAYKWLGRELDISEDKDCHIGLLTEAELDKMILILRKHRNDEYILFKRRKEKNAIRKSERHARQDNRINRRRFN